MLTVIFVFSGMTFKLRLDFPDGYPYSAPTVRFTSPCYHPNVDQVLMLPSDGHVWFGYLMRLELQKKLACIFLQFCTHLVRRIYQFSFLNEEVMLWQNVRLNLQTCAADNLPNCVYFNFLFSTATSVSIFWRRSGQPFTKCALFCSLFKRF